MIRTHVIIVDGTLSRLEEGQETNAGILYKLLREVKPRTDLTIYYHPGIQGTGLSKWVKVAAGIGINLTISAGYRQLSKFYNPGDRIMLFGFSRGAYSVRSLAGMITRIGLLHREHVTDRRVERAFRHYETDEITPASRAFTRAYCHDNIKIELIGVWDTVKALGIDYPLLWRIAPMATDFHDHQLSPTIANAFQALALDETRKAYEPILWNKIEDFPGHAEQLWFPGAHADIGGHVASEIDARALSNIPLVWMLEKAESCALPLPANWRDRFTTDPAAPMVGNMGGMGKTFIRRARRKACMTPFDALHPSVLDRMSALPKYQPKAMIGDDHLIARHAPAV